MNTKTKTISYKKIMSLFIILFVIVLFGYAILMNAVVSTSKKLTLIQKSVVSVQTKIAQTEQEILILRKLVTKEDALAQGFIENKDVAYVKTDLSKTAFLNE